MAVENGCVTSSDLSGVVELRAGTASVWSVEEGTTSKEGYGGNEILTTMTWALKEAASLGGSFFVSPQTFPRRMSLTDTFLTLEEDGRQYESGEEEEGGESSGY